MLLYARVALFNFSVYMAYPVEMLAAFVKPFINLGFTLIFWSIVAMESNGNIHFRSIVAYFLIATAMSNFLLIGGLRLGSTLAKAIKNGDLNYPLIRPVSIPFFYLASRIGSLGITYAVSGVLFIAGLLLQPPTSGWSVALFVAYLVPALTISYSLNLLIGVIAFYFTEADSIKNVIMHFINVFSGTIIPLTLFPGALKTVVLLLPFATAVYGPTQALRTAHPTTLTWLGLISGYVWAVVLLMVATKLWQRSLKRYEAVGI